MNRSFPILRALVGVAVLSAAGPLTALTAEAVSAVGTLETIPPDPGTLVVPATASFAPIVLNYSGAADADTALAEVQLWYRTEAGSWAFSTLAETLSAGSLAFVPPGTSPDNHGTYHFQLVATDAVGNSSPVPAGASGLGQGSVEFDTTTSVGNWWVLE